MSSSVFFAHAAKVTSLLLLVTACTSTIKPPVSQAAAQTHMIHPAGITLQQRISVPDGYTRPPEDCNSFAGCLRELPLKPDGSLVHYFNGDIKNNNGVYVAVIDLPIGNRDLQQCADAVMHLRAEYLYAQHKQNQIHFTFTSGFRADYSKWMQGYRIAVNGNNAEWVATAEPGDSREIFNKYMDVVYAYCGSKSLSKELKKVPYTDLQAGDVLVKGGLPGHAEIVLDVATNKAGSKIYLLAQSYMPAQDIQVLANRADKDKSPWYELNTSDKEVTTPEYVFTTDQLMRFEDN